MEVRDSVGRFHYETFGELVARRKEFGEIGFFQIGAFPEGRNEGRRRLTVHTGVVGNEVLGVIRRIGVDVHVVHVQLDHRAAGERDA